MGEFTLEELTKRYEEAKKNFEHFNKLLEEKKEEERKAKEVKLAKEKDARKAEVDLAFDKWVELRKAYEKDYGSYALTRNYINEFPWALFWN